MGRIPGHPGQQSRLLTAPSPPKTLPHLPEIVVTNDAPTLRSHSSKAMLTLVA